MFILQMGVVHHISVCQSDSLSVSVSLSQRKNTSSRLQKVFRGFTVNALNILFWGFYVPDTSQGMQFFFVIFSCFLLLVHWLCPFEVACDSTSPTALYYTTLRHNTVHRGKYSMNQEPIMSYRFLHEYILVALGDN